MALFLTRDKGISDIRLLAAGCRVGRRTHHHDHEDLFPRLGAGCRDHQFRSLNIVQCSK